MKPSKLIGFIDLCNSDLIVKYTHIESAELAFEALGKEYDVQFVPTKHDSGDANNFQQIGSDKDLDERSANFTLNMLKLKNSQEIDTLGSGNQSLPSDQMLSVPSNDRKIAEIYSVHKLSQMAGSADKNSVLHEGLFKSSNTINIEDCSANEYKNSAHEQPFERYNSDNSMFGNDPFFPTKHHFPNYVFNQNLQQQQSDIPAMQSPFKVQGQI